MNVSVVVTVRVQIAANNRRWVSRNLRDFSSNTSKNTFVLLTSWVREDIFASMWYPIHAE